MTLFYTGYRPILRGQSDSDWVNTYTGKLGFYSNWSLMSTEHLLEGAPEANHVPGTGYFPGDVFMSRRFLGLDTKNAMDGSGAGPRVYYGVGRSTTYGPGLELVLPRCCGGPDAEGSWTRNSSACSWPLPRHQRFVYWSCGIVW